MPKVEIFEHAMCCSSGVCGRLPMILIDAA